MKRKIIIILIAIFTLSLSCFGVFTACKNDKNKQPKFAYETEEKVEFVQAINLTDFASAVSDEELESFAMQGKNNSAYKTGIRVSSYYTTKINGEAVDTYMIPTAETLPHSVVFLDVSEDLIGKGIDVEITANFEVKNAIILPEKRNIEPEITQNTVKFSVNEYNNYTLITDENPFDPQRPFTIYVRKPEKVQVPFGYTLVEYKPGLHFVDRIEVKSNTVVYLHAGALVIAKNPNGTTEQSTGVDSMGCTTYKPFIYGNACENVKILGHGVIDLSQLPWHARSGLRLDACKNVEVNGITMLNSSTWTMTYMYCENLTVEDCIIFGYRTNSDAYAMCSCKNTVVKNSFARSGDDLFEVKTYGSGESENVLFENNIAWPDNCRGFGIVQETHSNIKNITYRDCSLLYQLKNWSEHMASYVITAGEPGNVSDILFENCDLFYSEVYALRFSVGQNAESSYDSFNNKITGVTFRNCNFKDGRMKVRNVTTDSNAISNITFENFVWAGNKLSENNPITFDIEGNGCEIIYK